METNKINLRTGVLAFIILTAAFSRLIPHLPNFSPLAAIGLFGAAYIKKCWQVFLIPIAATWLSDLLINNVIYAEHYPSFTWFYGGFYWQYGSYLLITLLGIFMFKRVNASRILSGALMATMVFFLITNFGCWIGNPTYPQNAAGLMACYVAGLPFIKGTLLGSLFYSATLFGTFALMQKKFTLLKLA